MNPTNYYGGPSAYQRTS